MTVLDGLGSLIDKSLLQQREIEVGKEQEPRFLLLETIREYGLEVLAASGELQAARQAHALYYLALVEQAAPHLKGSEQGRWFARLQQELDNLRAALAWLLEAARQGHALTMNVQSLPHAPSLSRRTSPPPRASSTRSRPTTSRRTAARRSTARPSA